jgi:predicted CDP-diglyceride synthetase/phosphatidate cytidylyltransferase
MTVEPMIRLIGGAFVAASVLLGMYVHPYFLWFTLFVGLNLVQSAFTGWCPMMSILRRLGVKDAVGPDELLRTRHS